MTIVTLKLQHLVTSFSSDAFGTSSTIKDLEVSCATNMRRERVENMAERRAPPRSCGFAARGHQVAADEDPRPPVAGPAAVRYLEK